MLPADRPGGERTAAATNENLINGCYRKAVKKRAPEKDTAYYADILAAIGTEPRLRIMRLLLSAHPEGMVVGDILTELQLTPSTLSHHLDKLKMEDLVTVRRDTRYLWYSANTETLQELLTFLYSECCSRNKAIKPDVIINLCK
jgi:DNA-binding transcriptional ArsR family regulator